LDKGMALEPEKRYQTIDAFLSDLRAALAALQPSRPTPPPKRTALVATLGVLSVAAVLVVLWMYPAPKPVQPGRVERADGIPPTSLTSPPQSKPAQPEKVRPSLESTPTGGTSAPSQPPQTQPDAQTAPIVLPPAQPSPTDISSMREYVRQAAEYQIHLRKELTLGRDAFNALKKLKAISTSDQSINFAIQKEQILYDSAKGDQEKTLNRYMAQIEWLAGHDEVAVDAAVKLEQDAANTITIDRGDADFNAQISNAISLLAIHVRFYRQKQLTRDTIIADVNKLIKT